MAGAKKRSGGTAETPVSPEPSEPRPGAKGKARTSGSKAKREDKKSDTASRASSPVAKRARGEKVPKKPCKKEPNKSPEKESKKPAKGKKGAGGPKDALPADKRKREAADSEAKEKAKKPRPADTEAKEKVRERPADSEVKEKAKKQRPAADAKDQETVAPAKKVNRVVVFGASTDYDFLAPVCGRFGLHIASEVKLLAREKVRCVVSQKADGAAFLALSQGIPVVSPEWLYLGLAKGELPSMDDHLLFQNDFSRRPLDDMTIYTIGRWPLDCGQGLDAAIRMAGGKPTADPFVQHDLTVVLDPSAERPPRDKGPSTVTVDWLIRALSDTRPPSYEDFLYVPPEEEEPAEITPPKAKRRRENTAAPKAKGGDQAAHSEKAKPKSKAKKGEKAKEKAKETEPEQKVSQLKPKSPSPVVSSPVVTPVNDDNSESEIELSPPTPVRREKKSAPKVDIEPKKDAEPEKQLAPPASPTPLDPTVPAGASLPLGLDASIAQAAAMSPTFSKLEDDDEAEAEAENEANANPGDGEQAVVVRRLSLEAPDRTSTGQQPDATALPEEDDKEDEGQKELEQEEEADEDSEDEEMV